MNFSFSSLSTGCFLGFTLQVALSSSYFSRKPTTNSGKLVHYLYDPKLNCRYMASNMARMRGKNRCSMGCVCSTFFSIRIVF